MQNAIKDLRQKITEKAKWLNCGQNLIEMGAVLSPNSEKLKASHEETRKELETLKAEIVALQKELDFLLTPKTRNQSQGTCVELLKDQEQALEGVIMIQNLIRSHNSNYYSYLLYDLENKFIAKWVEQGIINKGVKNSKYPYFPPKQICILNEKRITDLELCKALLIHFFDLEGTTP